MYYIPTSVSPPNPSATYPTPIHSCSFQKRAGLTWIPTKHGISSCSTTKQTPPFKARQSNSVWGIVCQKSQRQSPLPLLGVPQRPRHTIITYMQSLDPCRLCDFQFSLCLPLWSQHSWFCGFSCEVLDPSECYNPCSLPAPFPFYKILWALPNVWLWSLFHQLLDADPDDDCAELLSTHTAEYH